MFQRFRITLKKISNFSNLILKMRLNFCNSLNKICQNKNLFVMLTHFRIRLTFNRLFITKRLKALLYHYFSQSYSLLQQWLRWKIMSFSSVILGCILCIHHLHTYIRFNLVKLINLRLFLHTRSEIQGQQNYIPIS